MIISTTHTLEGYSIREYRGIVTGEAIPGANVVRDVYAGIDIDYETSGENGDMLMVTAAGTAVKPG